MKKNFTKLCVGSLVAMAAFAMISCSNPSISGDKQDCITITDAQSLAKAIECNVSDYICEAPDDTEESGKTAKVAASSYNKAIRVDVEKMLKSQITSSSGFIVLNSIAGSDCEKRFDEEISLNLTKAPENLNEFFAATGITEEYYLQLFNNAKIKMHKFNETEYGIEFQYTRQEGVNTFRNVNAYILVIGNKSNNLTVWYMEKGEGSGVTSYNCTFKNGNTYTIKEEINYPKDIYGNNKRVGYLYIKNETTTNCYTQSTFDVKVDGSDKLKYFGNYGNAVGYFRNDKMVVYYGMSKKYPSVFDIKLYDSSKSRWDSYYNSCYLENRGLEVDLIKNYYNEFHKDDGEYGVDADASSNPLYYTNNEVYAGVKNGQNVSLNEIGQKYHRDVANSHSYAIYDNCKLTETGKAKITKLFNEAYSASN